jgi:hypothetical protein
MHGQPNIKKIISVYVRNDSTAWSDGYQLVYRGTLA